MDIRDDKSLWEPMILEGVGKVLLVEESYYDAIVDYVDNLKINTIPKEFETGELLIQINTLVEENEEYKKVVYILERHNEQSQDMYNRVHDELEKAQELIKLLYNDMGESAEGDHAQWMKIKEYCFKNKLVSYEK